MSAHGLINITMEAVCLVFVSLILVACQMRKTKTPTVVALMWLVGSIMLIYLCQILEWILSDDRSMLVQSGLRFGLYKFLFVVDYGLMFAASCSFHGYLLRQVDMSCQERGIARKLYRWQWRLIAVSGIAGSLMMFISLFTGSFFYFDAKGMEHFTSAYFICLMLCAVGPFVDAGIILVNRKLLGYQNAVLLMVYCLIPVILLPLDLWLDLCNSYCMLGIVAFLLYIGIDIRQDVKLQEQETKLARQATEMIKIRVNLMMSQIQPHFLYNALSSISSLCAEDPLEAQKATNEFAAYLRGNLHSINTNKPIPFQQELELVGNYLKIEKRRFPERLKVLYEINSTDFQIPPLTLQPIVENVVRHCVAASFGLTLIKISSIEKEDGYAVCVADNGKGFDVSAVQEDGQMHLGLRSVRSRLAEMCGGTLTVNSRPGKGTRVTIFIPKQGVMKHENPRS